MDLSIIIVNWKSIGLAENCIRSLYETVRQPSFEIILFENASGDDCSRVAELFPGVRLIRSQQNLGFAGANNEAQHSALGENLLFLNPDTIAHDGAIDGLCAALDRERQWGVVGCRLINPDGSVQLSSIQRFPTICNQLLAIGWLQRRLPGWAVWGKAPLYAPAADLVQEVEAVSGACLMCRREAFIQVSGFSTEYFMYAEEVDLCRKLRSQGWKVGHLSSAVVTHLGGQSSAKRGEYFAATLMRDSVFQLLRKFRGPVYAGTYRATIGLSAIVRCSALYGLAWGSRAIRRRNLAEASESTARKWFYIAKWSLCGSRAQA